MSKAIRIIYAVYCYLISGIVLLFFIGFYDNLFLDNTVSLPISTTPEGYESLIDFGLLILFGVQHSVMSRKWFKKWWTQIIPPPIERATYLYMTSLMTFVLVYFWQPLPHTVWSFSSEVAVIAIYFVYFSIWAMMTAATFQFGYLNFYML